MVADYGGVLFQLAVPARLAGITLAMDPARRPTCELPQGWKAARVNGLWRVRGVPFSPGAAISRR